MTEIKYDIKLVTYICMLHDQGKTDIEIMDMINRKGNPLYVLAPEELVSGWHETKRQTYEFIKSKNVDFGYTPSIRDIAVAYKHSNSTIHRWIDILIDEGWIEVIRNEKNYKLPRTMGLPRRKDI